MTTANRPNRLLCLCDSPTLETGFGRVAHNLITRWHASGFFETIAVHAIGHNGFPVVNFPSEIHLYPAQVIKYPLWHDVGNLNRFLQMIESGFTHVWMMQDLFALEPMAAAFRDICKDAEVKSFLYFPVDSELEPSWTRMLAPVDVAVAYTEYGRREAWVALKKSLCDPALDRRRERRASQILVLPHGSDTAVYFPCKLMENPTASRAEIKAALREILFKSTAAGGRPLVGAEDFLITCVAQNQKRKALPHVLAIFARILDLAPELNPKLWMHMHSQNVGQEIDLKSVASQLGLVVNENVFFADNGFQNGHAKIEQSTLNTIYNASDLMLTASYGEGWGLPITEAMCAGIAVAGPRHTAVEEILDDGRGILFDTIGFDFLPNDNNRLRPRPDVDDAARRIVEAATLERKSPDHEGSLSSFASRGHGWATSDFLNWDRIAGEWLTLFKASYNERHRG